MPSKLKELERQRSEIQSRIWKIEESENEKVGSALVGRYFKYHNSGGGADERWWLYFKAVRAESRYVVGPKFQHIPTDNGGRFELEANNFVHNRMSGYHEIDAAEYVRARADFLAKLNEAAQA